MEFHCIFYIAGYCWLLMQQKANHFTKIIISSKSREELFAIVEDLPGYDEAFRQEAASELESRNMHQEALHASADIAVLKRRKQEQGFESLNIFVPKKKPGALALAKPGGEDLLLPYPKEDVLVLASATKRCINFIIDYVAAFMFMMFVSANIGVAADFLGSEVFLEVLVALERVIGLLWFFVYYIFFEYVVNGKTIGKMITKTRVLDDFGEKPRFKNIAGRTLARIIPFEFFSFLGDDPIGWHDSLSGTVVIDEQKSVLRSNWL